MKSRLSKILSLFLVVCFSLTLCFSMTACNETPGNETTDKTDKLESDSGVIVEGAFDKGAQLVTDRIEVTEEEGKTVIALLEDKEYDKKGEVRIFDISVVKDGSKVQPSGKVKVTLAAPFGSESGYVTFHIKDDNSVETLKTTYANGKITFETDSFSYFVVAAAPSDSKGTEVYALSLDGSEAGFDKEEAIYLLGSENKPDPQAVIVKSVSPDETLLLGKDEYTIDLGGLDFEKEGTYTITYTYKENTSVKATLTINVVRAGLVYKGETEPVTVNYTGGCATWIYKKDFVYNGKPYNIDDENSEFSYEWRDTDGNVVEVCEDSTWLEDDHFYTPSEVGTYRFVVYKTENGVKKDVLTLERTIKPHKLSKILELGEIDPFAYYSVVAEVPQADGSVKYYAMSMPEQYPNGGVVSPIEVTPDADGNIELGNNNEFIFRPYYMGQDQWTDYYGLCIGGGSYKHGGVVLTYGSGKIFYYDWYDSERKVKVRFRYDYDGVDGVNITGYSQGYGGTLGFAYTEADGYYFTGMRYANNVTYYPIYLYKTVAK